MTEVATETDPRLLFTGQSPFGWHRYETFMLCPRKYAYSYVEEKHEGPKRTALNMGTYIHLGLAHHYSHLRAKQRGENCDLYGPTEAIRVFAPPGAESALAQATVEGYVRNWAFERVEVLHVEEVFNLDFNGAPLTVRVDLGIRSKGTNKVHFVDHKYSGRVTGTHPKFYSASGQFLTLRALGVAYYGSESGGPILNLIQPDPLKFERPNLDPAPGHQRWYPLAIQKTYARIKALEGEHPDSYPRHQTEHTCWTRYGPCPFYDRCIGSR